MPACLVHVQPKAQLLLYLAELALGALQAMHQTQRYHMHIT